jgi:tetratricopeptide (TPR) repeat protein
VEAAMAEEASKPEFIARQDGTMALAARCLQRLGEMRIDAGNYSMGRIKGINFEMDYLAQAMERFEKLGNAKAIAYCQIYVAQRIWINASDQGIQHLIKTRDEFLAMGDAAGAAKCELKLGDHYLNSRNLGKSGVLNAFAACKRAFAQSNEAYHMALCNRLLSRIYICSGWSEDARSLLEITIKSLQEFGDRAAVADCLRSLATLHRLSKRHDDACTTLRQAIVELTWLGKDLDAAFSKWRLGDMCDDEEAVELYQEAIPQFYASVFVYADAECRFCLGQRYMRMGRFSDALLHLEIARHQLVLNETRNYATLCLLHIIQAMCSDGNIEGAKLMLEQKMAEIRGFLTQQERFREIQEEDLELSIENGRLNEFLNVMSIGRY